MCQYGFAVAYIKSPHRDCVLEGSSVKQRGRSTRRLSLPLAGRVHYKTSFLGLLPFSSLFLKRIGLFFQSETHSVFPILAVVRKEHWKRKLVTCRVVYNYSVAKSIACQTPSLTRTFFISIAFLSKLMCRVDTIFFHKGSNRIKLVIFVLMEAAQKTVITVRISYLVSITVER